MILLRLLAALAIAININVWLPIEWTTAKCNGGYELGQPFAAYGIPFPFMLWGGGSSMEYEWVETPFFANLVILTVAAFLAMQRLRFKWRWLHLFWIAPANLIGLFFLSAILVHTVDHLGYDQPIAWDEFRPVGIGGDGYECTPSPYWFPKTKDTK